MWHLRSDAAARFLSGGDLCVGFRAAREPATGADLPPGGFAVGSLVEAHSLQAAALNGQGSWFNPTGPPRT